MSSYVTKQYLIERISTRLFSQIKKAYFDDSSDSSISFKAAVRNKICSSSLRSSISNAVKSASNSGFERTGPVATGFDVADAIGELRPLIGKRL
jgi:hypothetical protein